MPDRPSPTPLTVPLLVTLLLLPVAFAGSVEAAVITPAVTQGLLIAAGVYVAAIVALALWCGRDEPRIGTGLFLGALIGLGLGMAVTLPGIPGLPMKLARWLLLAAAAANGGVAGAALGAMASRHAVKRRAAFLGWAIALALCIPLALAVPDRWAAGWRLLAYLQIAALAGMGTLTTVAIADRPGRDRVPRKHGRRQRRTRRRDDHPTGQA